MITTGDVGSRFKTAKTAQIGLFSGTGEEFWSVRSPDSPVYKTLGAGLPVGEL